MTIPLDHRQLDLPLDPKVLRRVESAARLPMTEVMLRFAEQLAVRSTCHRLHVGAVVTDHEMLQVLGIGYNGNAAKMPNRCDRADPGQCGCLHAEINALLKAPGTIPMKRMFVTHAPCLMCAKAMVNAGIINVYYRTPYRLTEGVDLLAHVGISVVHLPPILE